MIAAAGQMLNPSALDWSVMLGGPAVAVGLLMPWSRLRPRFRRTRRDRES